MHIFITSVLTMLSILCIILAVGFIISKRNAAIKQKDAPLRITNPVTTHHIIRENTFDRVIQWSDPSKDTQNSFTANIPNNEINMVAGGTDGIDYIGIDLAKENTKDYSTTLVSVPPRENSTSSEIKNETPSMGIKTSSEEEYWRDFKISKSQ